VKKIVLGFVLLAAVGQAAFADIVYTIPVTSLNGDFIVQNRPGQNHQVTFDLGVATIVPLVTSFSFHGQILSFPVWSDGTQRSVILGADFRLPVAATGVFLGMDVGVPFEPDMNSYTISPVPGFTITRTVYPNNEFDFSMTMDWGATYNTLYTTLGSGTIDMVWEPQQPDPGLTVITPGEIIVTAIAARITVAGQASPLYSLCLLYDPNKTVQSGATVPIKLELCNNTGNDLSSPAITLHAVSLIQVTNTSSGQVNGSGRANPNNDFRFDPTLGTSGGYIFNLSTKGLSTGRYNLNFTVTGDSFIYAVPFQVQ
jgi:hypothetical protein